MIVNATASLKMNNLAALYINDEKNAREPASWRYRFRLYYIFRKDINMDPSQVREQIGPLVMSFWLCLIQDSTAFPTVVNKPRHQQYHIESENSEATKHQINGNFKKIITVIKSAGASFTRIDVHFAKGEENSAARLEGAAKNKKRIPGSWLHFFPKDYCQRT